VSGIKEREKTRIEEKPNSSPESVDDEELKERDKLLEEKENNMQSQLQ